MGHWHPVIERGTGRPPSGDIQPCSASLRAGFERSVALFRTNCYSPLVSSFSQRYGLIQPPKIRYREDLSVEYRQPIIDLLRRYLPISALNDSIAKVFNPYGIESVPMELSPMEISTDENNLDFIAAKRTLIACPWFRLFDVVEHAFQQLDFYEAELRTDPDEEARAFPLQRDLNEYFVYAGIGWQMVNGEIVRRGEDSFERTTGAAVEVLTNAKRPTAAEHLKSARRALSERPKANTSGAVSHATSAIECVLGDLTGEAVTLGKYLDRHPTLFHPALKKALDGVYGYASDAGARHGKEGVEPSYEEAQFAVATCSAACTLFTNQPPQLKMP